MQKKPASQEAGFPLVPKEGLEPSRGKPHYALNVARLPIPPLRPERYKYTEAIYIMSLSEPRNSALLVVLERR